MQPGQGRIKPAQLIINLPFCWRGCGKSFENKSASVTYPKIQRSDFTYLSLQTVAYWNCVVDVLRLGFGASPTWADS